MIDMMNETIAHLLRPGKAKLNNNEKWDVSGIIPVPLFDLDCPVCKGKNTLLLRRMDKHLAEWSPIFKHRVRYWMKCGDTETERGCGYLFLFGIIVHEKMYNGFPNGSLNRAQIKKFIENKEWKIEAK